MSPPLVVTLHLPAIKMVLPRIPAAANLSRSMSTPPAHLTLHILRVRREYLGQTGCRASSSCPWLPPHHLSLPYQINNFSARWLVFCMQHRQGQVPNRRLILPLPRPDQAHPPRRLSNRLIAIYHARFCLPWNLTQEKLWKKSLLLLTRLYLRATKKLPTAYVQSEPPYWRNTVSFTEFLLIHFSHFWFCQRTLPASYPLKSLPRSIWKR